MNRECTKNVGRKFEPDGSYKHFEGNTIICKVKPDCSFYPIAQKISQHLQDCCAAQNYTFLPFNSFHMTMIQGVCDVDRTPELWTSFLPLDAPLVDTDRFFAKQFAKALPFPKITMVFDYIDMSRNIIIVRLKPQSPEDKQRLAMYRNHLSELIGIRFPDHESYGFHLSIAYQIWQSTDTEEQTLEKLTEELNSSYQRNPPSFVVPAPVLTYFKNMAYFNENAPTRD